MSYSKSVKMRSKGCINSVTTSRNLSHLDSTMRRFQVRCNRQPDAMENGPVARTLNLIKKLRKIHKLKKRRQINSREANYIMLHWTREILSLSDEVYIKLMTQLANFPPDSSQDSEMKNQIITLAKRLKLVREHYLKKYHALLKHRAVLRSRYRFCYHLEINDD